MKKFIYLVLVVILLASLFLAGCGSTGNTGKKVVLRENVVHPSTDYMAKYTQTMANRFNTKWAGKYEITVHPGGALLGMGETLDGVLIIGDGTTPDETLDEFNNVTEIECYNQKVWYPGTNTITQWGHNRRLIRYADVLLMAAEALNENDKPGEALIYLNRVRERAREGNSIILPDITETNKDLLRDIILNERRHELALEGHRFWDLIRSGKASTVLAPLGFVAGKHELLPIPQNEIDISQGTLIQNPNW